MPVNEFEEGIWNLYELDNASLAQNLSQAASGSWPVLGFNHCFGNLAPTGAPLNFNLNNLGLRQSDSLKGHSGQSVAAPFIQDHVELTSRPLHSRSLSTNDFLLGCQNLQSKQNEPVVFGDSSIFDQQNLTPRGFSVFRSQPENDCADSPTLTTHSERSDITEASSDFNFLRGQQQLARDQRLGIPQFQPMQQSGFNDMQLLQQHMMLKQLQELQRQQQFQQLGDMRQPNSLNQFSAVAKQTAGSQFSPLINGTPVHDASQMLRNWMQRGASPAAQGVSNKVIFSQEQGQAMHSMGLVPQQLDVSLYGAPVSGTRGTMSQHPNLQGMSHDSINLLTKGVNQGQNSMMQSSSFGTPYVSNQSNVPSEVVGLTQGGMLSKQGLQAKDNFGHVPIQGLNSGVFDENMQDGNALQLDASAKEFNASQEQVGWPEMQQTKLGPSPGLVPLDPMEAKILYNMDDNIWEAFGGRPDVASGAFANTLDPTDSSNAFPSIQSGSWSALMQSAVAEASSSDTGVQEEWSGLTFQNQEPSTDNQISSFMDNDKQQTGWADNNMQTATSFSSKSFPMVTDSSFPGFQQSGIQLLTQQRENIVHSGSHQPIENYSSQRKQSGEEGQKIQTYTQSENSWPGQMFEQSQSDVQHHAAASGDILMDNKGNDRAGKSRFQMSNGPSLVYHSSGGVSETYKQQHNYQSQNPTDLYTSKELSGHDHPQFEQFKFVGNVSGSAMNVDKGSLPDSQENSRASEERSFRGNHGSSTSATFHGSLLPDGSKSNAHRSEHMLELLHKVDQSRDDGTMAQFVSASRNPQAEGPGPDSHGTSVPHLYNNQSAAAQGFGLRLSPPSQRLPTPNGFGLSHVLPQTVGNLNSIQGNSTGSSTSNPPYSRNQFQMHPMSNVPVASQALQPTVQSAPSGYPPINQSPLQDGSRQTYSSHSSQQFPVLDASPVSQPSTLSGVSQQGEVSAKPHNVWRNVTSPRQPVGMESLKFPSSLPSPLETSTGMSTSWASRGSNGQNFIQGRSMSSDFGAASSSQGFDDQRQEHPGKDMSQHQISSKLHGAASQASLGQETASGETILIPGSSPSHTWMQERDRARHSNNPVLASSERDLETLGQSHNRQQNYSLLHQVQAMNNVVNASEVQQGTTLGGQLLDDNTLRNRNPMDGMANSALQPNSVSPGDTKMLSFMADAKDGSSVKVTVQPSIQARPSQEVVTQSSGSNVLSNHTSQRQVNLQMAATWFRQYGGLKNGQILSLADSRLGKPSPPHFSPENLSQNLHIRAPSEQLDAAEIGQGGRVWPGTAVTSGSSRHSSASYLLPSEATNHVHVMRLKKRKISVIGSLPWHKEVAQDSKRLQHISVSEQEWAQATNRRFEKVQDEFEVIEDVQPVVRSKRRLLLSTQLMQLLFRPAPASIFSADSTSSYDILSYFVSRLSLGDACNLAFCTTNDVLSPIEDSNMDTEKHSVSARTFNQRCSEVLEELIDRAKRVENDLQRLDKATSVVDMRVEIQELERFSVINRFAKFHVRGQADSSITSSSQKPIPQRYVTAFPMPRNLPEGVQCLSL